MDGSRFRRLAFLAILSYLTGLCLSPGLRADPIAKMDEDYQPVEDNSATSSNLVGLNVWLATLAAPPPWLTVIKETTPQPTPTVVIASAPTPNPITVNGPGVQQTPDPWQPNIPDPIITDIHRTPEPGTLLSGTVGLGLLWLMRRRSRTSGTSAQEEPSAEGAV